MPKHMEKKLRAEAAKRGLKGRHAAAFVFGTMRKMGWAPSHVEWKKHKGKKRKG